MSRPHSNLIFIVPVVAGITYLLASARSCGRTAAPPAICIWFTNVNASVNQQHSNGPGPLWVLVATNVGRRHVDFWAESLEYKTAGGWVTNPIQTAGVGGFLFSGAVGPTSRFEGVFSPAPTSTKVHWRVRFRCRESEVVGDLFTRLARSTNGHLPIDGPSRTVMSEEVDSP